MCSNFLQNLQGIISHRECLCFLCASNRGRLCVVSKPFQAAAAVAKCDQPCISPNCNPVHVSYPVAATSCCGPSLHKCVQSLLVSFSVTCTADSGFESLQTSQDKMQAFLTAVGGMVQYAREDEAVQLQTVSPACLYACLPCPSCPLFLPFLPFCSLLLIASAAACLPAIWRLSNNWLL